LRVLSAGAEVLEYKPNQHIEAARCHFEAARGGLTFPELVKSRPAFVGLAPGRGSRPFLPTPPPPGALINPIGIRSDADESDEVSLDEVERIVI